MINFPKTIAFFCFLIAGALAGTLDDRGWETKKAKNNKEQFLTPREAVQIEIPESFSAHLNGPTVILYISPRCPHCTAVIPELKALSQRLSGYNFLAVFSGNSAPGDVGSFVISQDLGFPHIHDIDKSFGTSLGLNSTPCLIVAEPSKKPPVDGKITILVKEAYLPYIQGADRILEMSLTKDPDSMLSSPGYKGSLTCAACHNDVARSWSMTRHSVSFYQIANKGGADKAECLVCHTTNPWVSGEYQAGHKLGNLKSPFAEVGCEACHTASGPHDGDGGNPKDGCTKCHDQHGYFEPQKALSLIDHYQGVGVDDDTLRQHAIDMALGKTPRPLMQLSGELTGPEACRDCHKSQYKSWKKSPHSEAKAESAFGVVDGSVTCESCHGSGLVHSQTQDPTKIRSLKTPHPECAVEGICMTCHNNEEGWNLQNALYQIKH